MWALGAFVALLLIAIRALSRDQAFRRDLQGAILFFFSFLVIRFVGDRIEDLLSAQMNRLVRVAWQVAFSFGAIRAAVALGLAFLKLRTQAPAPKIVRDVIDMVLYAVAAISGFVENMEVWVAPS